MSEYEIIEESNGYALVKRLSDGRCTVVRISRKNGQVYSAMPKDGSWFSGITDKGIAYVANFYSRGYARSVYRSLVAEAQEMAA